MANSNTQTKEEYLQTRIAPISPRDVGSVNGLLTALGGCSFQGRSLSRCLDVLENMARDESCLVVMTLAGAMVPGGMEETISQLIEEGIIDALVTTGANISHSMVNHADELNQGHYVGAVSADDVDLFHHSINRIYDTFLPEEGYHKGEVLLEAILKRWFTENEVNPEEGWNVRPSELFHIVGSQLATLGKRGILSAAARHNVPIFCGATSDSEFALNLVKYNERNNWKITVDELADVQTFANNLLQKERGGTFIIGGGVPRNWAQQAWPLLEMTGKTERHGYDMTVRVFTDSPAWGGLSGCTVSESVSWGKYTEKAVAAEVKCDATIALPLLTVGLFERLGINA
ncbi:MAG: deoxyhypusine synthase family protein [Ignavibacteriae bacterium]|nr:deoxyhypusine synthase family protein [Ignavibacteriota bacterium]MCB9216644.1 deoxyhypusine synthase family protein [Ignavibacteria bacterium]